MAIEKVAITGSKGVIGRVLTDRLGSLFQTTPIDLPTDLRDFDQAKAALTGQDAVVHLAWNKRKVVDGVDTAIDDNDSESIDPFNILMANNVYRAAAELG